MWHTKIFDNWRNATCTGFQCNSLATSEQFLFHNYFLLFFFLSHCQHAINFFPSVHFRSFIQSSNWVVRNKPFWCRAFVTIFEKFSFLSYNAFFFCWTNNNSISGGLIIFFLYTIVNLRSAICVWDCVGPNSN